MPRAPSAEEQGLEPQEDVAAEAQVLDQDAKPAEDTSDSDPQDAKGADSSPADDKDAKKEPSLLDVVKDAVKAEQAEDPSASESGQAGQSEEDPDAEAKGETKDDQLPFHNHPRWKELTAELKELRPLKEQVETVRPKAEAFDQLTRFIDDAHLSTEEVNEGFAVMRAMKNEPEKVLPVLEGYVAQLKEALGHTLPPELQQKVEQGYVDEATARTLSQTQAREARAAAAAEEARSKAEELQQQHDSAAKGQAVIAAVGTWDKKWAESDPDYALKVDRAKEKIELHIARNGLPETPEAAVEIAQEARKAVEAELRKFMPAKKPITPVQGGLSGKSVPQPQSSLDVVRQAVGG